MPPNRLEPARTLEAALEEVWSEASLRPGVFPKVHPWSWPSLRPSMYRGGGSGGGGVARLGAATHVSSASQHSMHESRTYCMPGIDMGAEAEDAGDAERSWRRWL